VPTSINLTIRQLKPNDLSLFEDLMTVFAGAFEEPETYTSKRPSPDYVKNLLASDYFIALTALKESKVVGGLAAYELKKFEQERSEIYIYALAVSEKHRREGIATALINRLKEVAIERGTYVIFVQADSGDEPPTSLYSKLGIREDVLHFDIAVESKSAKST